MSIHPEILALIHADIDGVASEEQQIQLRDAIARDTEVRDEYHRLRSLCEVLAQVEPAEPPADLTPAVIRAISARRNASSGGIAGRLRAFWPGGRQTLRYAYAVAAGAAIGVIATQLVSGGSVFVPTVRDRDVAATIGTFPGTVSLDLAPAGIRGAATLRPSASGAAIGLDLSAAEPSEFVLRYDPDQDGVRVDVLVMRGNEATPAGSLRVSRGH